MNRQAWISVWFYTGADYRIVNALLWCNKAELEEGIHIVHSNNTDIIGDAEKMTPEARFGLPQEEAQQLFQAYVDRTPKEITDTAWKQFVDIAGNDIHNICSAMSRRKKN